MSALVREFSQIEPRIKYYLAIDNTTYFLPDENYKFTAIMTESNFANHTNNNFFGISSSIYRDMGKQVITTDSQERHTNVYRLVQKVRGVASEGVNEEWEYYTYYIRTWSADPSDNSVTVVRTG